METKHWLQGWIGKAQVYLFLESHREHAIPRRSQLLLLDLLQQNFSFWQHLDVKVTTRVSI